jgi:hypothetical protein
MQTQIVSDSTMDAAIDTASDRILTGAPAGGKTEYLSIAAPLGLVALALVLWWMALPAIDVGQIGGLGLISVLPPLTIIAFGVLTVSFCYTLQQRQLRDWLAVVHVVALLFMLYAITTLVEEAPRFEATWKHAGITDYIMRNGSVDPYIDAYFNWPGFFILAAFVTELTGYQTPLAFAAWVPIFYNLLYLGAVYMILRAVTGDLRLVWLGLWFFFLTNWVGQDYFSPQGLSYFLMLVMLGILLTWFQSTARQPGWAAWLQRVARRRVGWSRSRQRAVSRDEPDVQPLSTPQLMALVVIVQVVFLAIVPSHQLTPFAALAAVILLVVARRCSLRTLPLLLGTIILAWMLFMSVTYLRGHLSGLLSDLGNIGMTVNKNVGGRIKGDWDHLIAVYGRLALTVVLWGLAGLGLLRRLRAGYWDLPMLLLFAAPFSMVLLQGYGGELILRVYFFALPFAVFFAAALFFPSPQAGRSWRTAIIIGAISLLLTGALFLTRYGNEEMDHFTANEVAAVDRLYEVAQPRSLLAASSYNVPWKYRKYEQYFYTPVYILQGGVNHIIELGESGQYPDVYVIITRSQIAQTQLFGVSAPDAVQKLESDLMRSPRFTVIFQNADAKVFQFIHGQKKEVSP